MFDFNSFEEELDAQNAALEAMLADLDDDNSIIDSALEKVQNTVNKKCDTIEACESYLNGLNTEIRKFNDAVSTMRDAGEMYQIDGDRNALKSAIAPASESLLNTYGMIANESVDTNHLITDKEISTMRDFLIGAKDIVNTRMDELGACESFYDSIYDNDVAMEGLNGAVKAVKNKIASLCNAMAKKCNNKMVSYAPGEKKGDKLGKKGKTMEDSKWYNFWKKMYNWFINMAKKLQGIKDDDASKVEQCKKQTEDMVEQCQKAENAEWTDRAEECFNDIDTYLDAVDIAYESYIIQRDMYESEIATEGIAMSAVDKASMVINIASVAVSFGGLIALAIKSGLSNENKYVRALKKEFKPKEKELKTRMKNAKKQHKWDDFIGYSKELITLNKKMLAEVESLGKDVTQSYRKNGDGSTSKNYYKTFTQQQFTLKEKLKDNIQQLSVGIKMAQRSKANESYAGDAFMEGYTSALEMMTEESDSFFDDFDDDDLMIY